MCDNDKRPSYIVKGFGMDTALMNWIRGGLVAMTFILCGKLIFTKINVPGVSTLFQAV